MNDKIFDALVEDVEKLKKEIASLSKEQSPSTNTPSTTPPVSDGEWTTIYDMTDEALNYGLASGIMAVEEMPANFPDLMPYSKMRVLFHYSEICEYFEFDISSNEYRSHSTISSNRYGTELINYAFLTFVDSTTGKKSINLTGSARVIFQNNKSVKVEYLDSVASCVLEKIEVK